MKRSSSVRGRFFIIMTLLIGATNLQTAIHYDEKCKDNCQGKTIKRTEPYVEIDANTGTIIHGRLKHNEGPVQLIFVRKNPFKYNYRFEIQSAPLSVAIISSFLNLKPGFSSTVSSIIGQELAVRPAPPGPDCPGASDEWDKLYKAAQPLTAKSAALKKKLEEKSKISDSLEAFIKKTDTDWIPREQCEEVCRKADYLAQNLKELIELADLTKTVQELKANTEELKPLIAAFNAKRETLKGEDATDCDVAEELKNINNLFTDIANHEKAVSILEANKKASEQMNRIVKSALAVDHPFDEEFSLTDDTGNSIRIFRTNLREDDAKEQQIGRTIQIDVGESPFSISAGIGFSTIEDKRFIRQSFVKDGMLGARFAEENKSSLRPSAMVILNGHIEHFSFFAANDATFALSTGFIFSSRNNVTDTEFIVGPSLGLLHDNLFLNIGLHVARVDSLGGGFKLGEPIPANLPDPLPVEKNWKCGFIFGITYKLR